MPMPSIKLGLRQNHEKLEMTDALHPEKPWQTLGRYYVPHITTLANELNKLLIKETINNRTILNFN